MLTSPAPGGPATFARVGRVPGAATVRVRDLLAGPARRGEVVHAGRDAVYVAVEGRCLGVLARNAVHVPCGILTALPALSGLAGLGDARPGDPVRTEDGALLVDGIAVSFGRLVPSTLPRIDDAARAHAALAPVVGTHSDAIAGELPADALSALAAGDPAAVGELLGRGSGLTPLGDDVVSGWLATAAAVDRPGLAAMRAEVSALAARRTTLLSAELLSCAVAGEVVPQFRALIAALAVGGPLEPSAGALVRIGHTSGAGLALGCLLALTPTEVRPTEGRPDDHEHSR